MAAPVARSAKASVLTGTILVEFDPAAPIAVIVAQIEGVLHGEVAPTEPDDREPEAAGESWWRIESRQVADMFRSSPIGGLSDQCAGERLAMLGRNVLPRPVARSPASIFLAQFQSLPVGLLAVASVVSMATAGLVEAAVILGVVGLNGVIGYVTESRAERIIQSLGTIDRSDAPVIRNGERLEVPVETIVPGDLIFLMRGMIVPADGRLVSARALTASEAALTGESLPVLKQVETVDGIRVALADRLNMVHRGTLITGGSGTAIVVATGMNTQVGQIQRLVGTSSPPQTPMQQQLDVLGRQIVWLALGISSAVFAVGWLRGFAFLQLLRSTLSLAVAAVPEGLPTVATTTLALGIEEMRHRGVLIRKLDAIETLARARVICFDKTGTLTRNEMRVSTIACGERALRLAEGAVISQTDRLARRLLQAGALCSEVEIEAENGRRELIGSSTERALVQAALDGGIDVQALRRRRPRVETQQRTESYRFMVSVHASNGGSFVAVKGSPAEVLERCRWEALPGGGRRPLTLARRAAIERVNADMANQALRVLGFADRTIGPGEVRVEDAAQDLVWIGLAGMADPVREGMPEIIARLHKAGLRTVMMTGDQSATAIAVAGQLGLAGERTPEVFDAGALDALPPNEVTEAVRRTHVFSRVSPAQKLWIIRELQSSGEVVAMVGDGINDSPALRSADVGIALGQGGSLAAREVADVVLESDDFDTLLVAIERGWTTYTNIRKSIRYLLSTNGSEIMVMVTAMAAGAGEALSPMQLLWINLISDILPGLGLALDPPEPGLMTSAPPADNPAIVGHSEMRSLATQAAMLSAGALAACAYGSLRYGASSGRTRTMTFTSLVMAQLLHAFTCRSTQRSAFGSRLPANRALGGAIGLSAILQIGAFAIPGVRRLLGLHPLGFADAMVVAAGGVLPFIGMETLKAGRATRPQTVRADRGVTPARPADGPVAVAFRPDRHAPRSLTWR